MCYCLAVKAPRSLGHQPEIAVRGEGSPVKTVESFGFVEFGVCSLRERYTLDGFG
jgi:hypothetical protein